MDHSDESPESDNVQPPKFDAPDQKKEKPRNRSEPDEQKRESSTPDRVLVTPNQKADVSSAESTENDFDIAVLEREDLRYGWGGVRPRWLQWCTHPIFVSVALCFCTVSRSFGMSGIFPSAARFMQLRFYLTTGDIGLIRMWHDAGHFITLMPVLYFGLRGANRPMWIGTGSIVVGVAAVMIALPQVFTPPFEHLDSGVCLPANTSVVSDDPEMYEADRVNRPDERACDEKWIQNFKYMFMAGAFLYGVGSGPVYAFGMTYMDENVSHTMSSLFNGMLTISSLFGAAAGFMSGGRFSRMDADAFKKEATKKSYLDADDPRWYGAWWIGFLLTAIINWLAAVIVLGFPFQLPGATRARIEDMKNKLARKGRYADPDVWESGAEAAPIQSVVKKCLKVLRCPYYNGLVISHCCLNFLGTAFGTFMPVFLQKTFRKSVSAGSYYAGGIVFVAIVSTVTGMFLQHILRLRVSGNMRLSFVAALGTLLFMGVFVVRCDEGHLAGVTDAYPISAAPKAFTRTLNATCNKDCGCSTENYDPVCYSPRGRREENERGREWTIFNKCYAGCRVEVNVQGDGVDCSCVPVPGPDRSVGGGNVTTGVCMSGCPRNKLYAFMIGLTWIVISLFIRKNAVEQSILRCVPFHLRMVSLAMADAFTHLLGQIPSSPLVGWVMTRACILWTNRCGVEGRCAWVNIRNLSSYTTAVGFVVAAIGAVGLGVALFTYDRSLLRQNSKSTASVSNRPPKKEDEKPPKKEDEKSPKKEDEKSPKKEDEKSPSASQDVA